MENTTTTTVHGYCAVAALQVRVLAPVSKPRSTGGVRLLADGGVFIIAPSGPPLID